MPAYKDKRNNTWYVKYQNKTKRGFETKREALLYEAKQKLKSNKETISITFKEVAYDFLNYNKINVSYATYDKYRNSIERHILPSIDGNKVISKIDELDCRNFFEKLCKTKHSTSYKNSILLVFKTIFKHAEKYFNLEYNPTRFMEKYKPLFEESIKKNAKEKSIWTDDEFKKFINEVNKSNYKLLFILLYYTGMRLGEALALTWNDFVDHSVSINKSITRKTNKGTYEIKQPKNISSYRNINLGSNLSLYLGKYKDKEKNIPGFSNDWLIFGRSNPLVLSSIDRNKESAIRKAGIKRIRIHDLRHSHASHLIASGVNIVAVSKRLGHSSVNITLSVYTHLVNNTDQYLIDILDKSIYSTY